MGVEADEKTRGADQNGRWKRERRHSWTKEWCRGWAMGDGATRASALSVGKLSCLFWVSSGPPAAPLCLPCCPPHRTVTRSDLSPHPSQATQPRLFHDTVTITE